MKFSERKGYTPLPSIPQREGMSTELRNTIWNYFNIVLWDKDGFTYSQYGEAEIHQFAKVLCYAILKKPMDDLPIHGVDVLDFIRKHFFKAKWFEVYDFVEFTAKYMKRQSAFEELNQILDRELAGYRFVDGILTDIITEEEIDSVETALSNDEYPGVRAHLRRALELLSDRKSPDYRNSIKESISAVESIAKSLAGSSKATLGDAIKVLEKSGRMHTALKESLSRLYGYTSDEGGVRHAMLDEPNLDVADAKFFLVTCSAFINYLKAKK